MKLKLILVTAGHVLMHKHYLLPQDQAWQCHSYVPEIE